MKTAMQELIDIIYERPTEISQFNATQLLKLIEPLLEKEKEQIMIANQKGYVEGGRYFTFGMQPISSEEYYNQTYNQNK